MTTPPLGASAQGSDSGGRQRSHIEHGDWEACWLTEQRTACAVVQYSENSSDAEHDPSRSQRPPEVDANADMSRRQAAATSTPNPHAYEQESSGLNRITADGGRMRLAFQASAFSPAGLLHVPIENSLDNVTGPTRSERATSSSPTPFRNSAHWRHSDDSLGVSMRVRDPEGIVRGVLPQLLEWIREAGGQLRKLIVNGRTLFDPQDAHRAGSGASRNTKRPHIYKE